jgi:hypothetical protein
MVLVAGLAVATAQEQLYADPAAAVPGAGAADYYSENPADRAYLQNRQSQYGYQEPSYYQQPQDPLIPNLYPTAILGGLGALGMAYFRHVIDQSYNKSLHAFEALHHNVDHRLEHLESAIYNRGKEQKKLDFKSKMLCKFANLFNNPTYEICNQGFDGGQVVGPTGANSGYGYAEEETDAGNDYTGSGPEAGDSCTMEADESAGDESTGGRRRRSAGVTDESGNCVAVGSACVTSDGATTRAAGTINANGTCDETPSTGTGTGTGPSAGTGSASGSGSGTGETESGFGGGETERF